MMAEDDTLTPHKIVEELDRYIVGQNKAKKAVAIALRNRIRRQRLPAEIREEIAPKNILMIGPTGVGKTEIARRLAKLCGAPFIKVEATKYTEVGYVGRDVESMVRDLMASSVAMVKEEMESQVTEEAKRRAEDRLLDILLPGITSSDEPVGESQATVIVPRSGTETKEKFRGLLREGKLDAREIEITVPAQGPQIELFAGSQFEEMNIALGGLQNFLGGKKKKKTVTVAEALPLLEAEERERLVDQEKIVQEARRRAQESGIIFIDEMDKIANRDGKGSSGVDVSREGVQRDMLPIVEGTTVNTKWGPIDTMHVLFIGAGAFNVSKPQDLIPELQGRFPIRVELDALSGDDFVRILTEPKNALVTQYIQLLGTENVQLEFSEEAIARIAEIAAAANRQSENIGARRLQTVMERLLEDVSFDADKYADTKVTIDKAYVDEHFKDYVQQQDLSKYIL
ncbi:MAG: ATP-dependent protease ATPase subunit HslU [Rectinema sp.]|uniref:ATP-dependent protease ATPase subunit HslU n=1 Tax=uncultured spirochete TaxID=156406 RepID=A0A3P3XTK5_9SPIR|nr:molecular chaperone and ATPase component of HslUV protease [uncultured spirochete]